MTINKTADPGEETGTQGTVPASVALTASPARWLRAAQVLIGAGVLATYLMWALNEGSAARPWHLASALPLAAAVVRFGLLSARRTVRPVEDLITRDAVMVCCEVAWLALFCVGLYAE